MLIYGATPAGIAAALAAAEDGEKVMLVEPTGRIGGMMTNGLSQADFLTFESLGGAFLRFAKRVEEAYRPEFGDEAAKVSFRGTHAEPKVNLAVFERMLAEQPRVTLKTNWALEGAECSSEAEGDTAGPMRALEVALFTEPNGERHSIAARYFIDATYEGDLMAAAGIPYNVGRESAAEYHESLAPGRGRWRGAGVQFPPLHDAGAGESRDSRGSRASTGARITPTCCRCSRTAASAASSAPASDSHLSRARPGAAAREARHQRHGRRPGAPLPARARTKRWPDGGGGVAIREGVTDAIERPPFSRLALATARQRIADEHRHWTVGLLYFLQHDEAVPERFRKEALEWGWCRDEFPENGHLPEQLYVREARRLIGRYVFTQNDTQPAPDDDRSPPQPDSVAIGEYGPLCLGTGHAGPVFGGEQTGGFNGAALPYQVPFGVMLPRQTENVLVTCAVSASHVGFCALRFEPTWVSLGEAAGHAAHLARAASGAFTRCRSREVQARLRAAGATTIYVSDVPPGDPLFAAVQWWGNLGGWHAAPARRRQRTRSGDRGATITRRFRHHAAELRRSSRPTRRSAGPSSRSAPAWRKKSFRPPSRRSLAGEWLKAVYPGKARQRS